MGGEKPPTSLICFLRSGKKHMQPMYNSGSVLRCWNSFEVPSEDQAARHRIMNTNSANKPGDTRHENPWHICFFLSFGYFSWEDHQSLHVIFISYFPACNLRLLEGIWCCLKSSQFHLNLGFGRDLLKIIQNDGPLLLVKGAHTLNQTYARSANLSRYSIIMHHTYSCTAISASRGNSFRRFRRRDRVRLVKLTHHGMKTCSFGSFGSFGMRVLSRFKTWSSWPSIAVLRALVQHRSENAVAPTKVQGNSCSISQFYRAHPSWSRTAGCFWKASWIGGGRSSNYATWTQKAA